MKRIGLLNRPLSAAIAGLGHTDMLVVADAGLPVPKGVQRIDLALVPGVPSIRQTLDAIRQEMEVERLIIAREVLERTPHILEMLAELFPGRPVESIPHEEFKRRTCQAAAVVRTGECTPYANVILVSGVTF